MWLKWLPEQGAVFDLALTEQPDKASLFAVSYISNKRHLPRVPADWFSQPTLTTLPFGLGAS